MFLLQLKSVNGNNFAISILWVLTVVYDKL